MTFLSCIRTPSFFSFHVANAFEDEQGRVHIFLCVMDDFDFKVIEEEGPPPCLPRLHEIILDPDDTVRFSRRIKRSSPAHPR